VLRQLATKCSSQGNDDCAAAAIGVALERDKLFNAALRLGAYFKSDFCYGQPSVGGSGCQVLMWEDAMRLQSSGKLNNFTVRSVVDKLIQNSTNRQKLSIAQVQASCDDLAKAHSAGGFRLSCRRKALADMDEMVQMGEGLVLSSADLVETVRTKMYVLSNCWQHCIRPLVGVLNPARRVSVLLGQQVQATDLLRTTVCVDDACRAAFTEVLSDLRWDWWRTLVNLAFASDFPVVDPSLSLAGIVLTSIAACFALAVLVLGCVWKAILRSLIWMMVLVVALVSGVMLLVLWVLSFWLPAPAFFLHNTVFAKQILPLWSRILALGVALLFALEVLLLAFFWVRMVHVDLALSRMGAKTPWVIGGTFFGVSLAALGSFIAYCVLLPGSEFLFVFHNMELFDYTSIFVRQPFVLAIPLFLAVVGFMAASVLLVYVLVVHAKLPLAKAPNAEERLKLVAVRVNVILAGASWSAFLIKLVFSILDYPVFDFYSMDMTNLLNITCEFTLGVSFVGLALCSWIVSHRLDQKNKSRMADVRGPKEPLLFNGDGSFLEDVPMQYSSELI
jgi:hypothetical protein